MGLFGGGNKKATREMDRVLDYAAAKAVEEADVMKSRIQAGAEAQWATLGMLGQPGTYTSPVGGSPGVGLGGITSPYGTSAGGQSGLLGSLGGGEAPGAGLDYQTGSVFKDKEVSEEAKKIGYAKNIQKSKILDPEKFAGMVSQMPVAQIISRQVAEAQGLTDPTSPFRQSLEQSLKNPILEGGASALRESQRLIKNGMAKGGSARRAALADAQNMLAIESSNRQVSQQLWQANLQFESWIRDYQRTTVNAAMAFTSGLGVAEYTNAMNAASSFMVKTALPTAVNMKTQSYKIAMENKKKSLGEMILGGAMMIGGAVGAFFTGGATAPLISQGAQMAFGSGAAPSSFSLLSTGGGEGGGVNMPGLGGLATGVNRLFGGGGPPSGGGISAGSGGGAIAGPMGPWSQ